MKNIITTLFGLLAFSMCIGQDYAKDMYHVFNTFSALTEYSFSTNLVVNDKVDGKETIQTSMKVSKHGQIVKSSYFDLLINRNVTVAIDHEYKEIKVSPTENFDEIPKQEGLDLEDFKMLIDEDTHYKYIGKTGNIVKYEVYLDGEIDRVVLEIDQAKHFFKKIEFIYLAEGGRMSSYYVEYLNYNQSPKFTASDFSESKIIKKQADGTYKLTPAYKGYHLIVDLKK